MWIIAYSTELRGWCVVSLRTHAVLSGPHATHEDAVQNVETSAHRIAQGWSP